MKTAYDAAAKIIAGYEEMNRLLPLAGGIPRPIEESDDNAVILARERLAAESQLADLRAEVERLRAREAELEAGLRPFAEYVKPINDYKDADSLKIGYYFAESPTVADVRRAAALLAKEPTT